MTTTPTVGEVRDYATKAWRTFTEARNLHATITWDDNGQTADGTPLVSALVTGRGAAYALYRFTADYIVVLGKPGDQRPQFDYSDPTRTACVWRQSGVWVELWVPADAVEAPEPKPEVGAAASASSLSESVVSALRGLGDRLPYSRNRHPKETTTA